MYKNISFFKGLNELRFMAALLVLFHHSETIRLKNNLFNFEWLSLFRNGTNAVNFFFVLSGFLITYLLLKESKITNDIKVKKFYLKRVLRIWPLYFLLFFIGTVLLPFLFHIFSIPYEMPYSFSNVWAYFVFFLPGLVLFFYGHHFLEPLWSIGVEELFYLIWAPIFKFFRKHILSILLGVILFKVLTLLVSYILLPENHIINYLLNTHSFELMAIGGWGAYLVFNSNKPIKNWLIFQKKIQFIIYILLITFLIFNQNINISLWNFFFKTPILSTLIIGFMYLYSIIGISLNENSILKPHNKYISYLGEISYGIYMYHMSSIFFVILILKDTLSKLSPLYSSLLFYILVISLTILISSLSKKYFEDFFLIKLRNKLIKH